MENKGLSAEQVEELIEFVSSEVNSGRGSQAIAPYKVIDKIRELQQPVRKYVELGCIQFYLTPPNADGVYTGEHAGLLEFFALEARTLEELKDGN